MKLPSVVFFGTTDFSVHVLRFLVEKGYPILAVVTKPDEPFGRGKILTPPPVKIWAEKHLSHLPLLQPERASSPEVISFLSSLQPEIFVVVAFGEILKPDLLAVPLLAPLNIHASLLPKFRGASPIRHAILAGEKESGISIIKMSPKLDAGGVIAAYSVPIEKEETFGTLEKKLMHISLKALDEAIKRLIQKKALILEQQEDQVSYAPKLKKEDSILDLSQPASFLDRQIRSLSPLPGGSATLCLKNGEEKRFKIFKAAVDQDKRVGAFPGALQCEAKFLWLQTGCGALALQQVQLEGKKEMEIALFLQGYRDKLSHLK